MKFQQPYCRIEYEDVTPVYRVYDRTGALLCYTHSRQVAQSFLDMANKGISARFYYWLERWNWRIPKYLVDRD